MIEKPNGYHVLKLYDDICCHDNIISSAIETIPDVSNYSSIKFYVPIRSRNVNIPDCLLFNCAFIISDVTIYCFFSLYKTSRKTTFSLCRFCFRGFLDSQG